MLLAKMVRSYEQRTIGLLRFLAVDIAKTQQDENLHRPQHDTQIIKQRKRAVSRNLKISLRAFITSLEELYSNI